MDLLFTYFILTVLFSFLGSILETVLLSIKPSYIERKLEENPSIGMLLDGYRLEMSKPLAAISIWKTIVHTVGAVFVGVQANHLFSGKVLDFNVFSISLIIVVAILMTVSILVIAQILPKQLGTKYWKKLVPFTIHSVQFLMLVLRPFLGSSQPKKEEKQEISKEVNPEKTPSNDKKAGVVQKAGYKITANLKRFEKVLVRDIMTPRMVVKTASEEMNIKDFFNENKDLRFSRIPIYEDIIDNVNGFILKDELLTKMINNEGDLLLKDIRRDILIFHEKMPIPKAFQKLMTKRQHIALVVDEFGSMEGIVTMEDVIETLLGTEIVDEYDKDEDMQALARKNWETRAKKLGILTSENNEE